MSSPVLTLNNGEKMPQVGFGLWKVPNESCADIVYNAIKTGYRLFDGACGMSRLSFSKCSRTLLFFFRPATAFARKMASRGLLEWGS